MENKTVFETTNQSWIIAVLKNPLKIQPQWENRHWIKSLQCEAPKIAKLVNTTPITMVYGLITIVTGAYKPTYNWGASHCSNISFM